LRIPATASCGCWECSIRREVLLYVTKVSHKKAQKNTKGTKRILVVSDY
jgi:hypothetical protein